MSASKAAQQLFGFFRRGDANDPETYVAGIAAVLTAYPEDVVRAVVKPGGQLACCEFMPNQREVRDACEKAMQPRYDAIAREAERKRVEAQLREREEWLARQAEMREEDIAKLTACSNELRKAHDPMAADREREEKAKARIREGLDRMREEHCSIETPSGIKISPALKERLDMLAKEDGTYRPGEDAA